MIQQIIGHNCRTPRGVRGLKFQVAALRENDSVAPPRGVRGLKCNMIPGTVRNKNSRTPSRGAWIEIKNGEKLMYEDIVRRTPSRGAWIEIC